MEPVAAMHALDVAASIGLNHVVLEGNALGVIQAINNLDEDMSHGGNIIEEIERKRLCFSLFCAKHVNRSANEAAHRAAEGALLISDFYVWMEELPVFLCDVLIQDNLSLHQ